MSGPTDYYQTLGVEQTASTNEIKRAYRRLARRYHPDVNNGDAQAERQFKAISEAYAVLSDPQKRHQYDRRGREGLEWTFEGGLDIFEIFRQAFGGDPFAQTARRGRGHTIQAEVSIDLEEVLHGTTRTIAYSRLGACEHCQGTGVEPGSTQRRCPTCGGSGQVRQTHQSFLGVMTTIGVCPDCGGQGQIVDQFCGQCHGKGVAELDEEIEIAIPAGIANGQQIVLRGAGDVAPGGTAGDLYVVINVKEHELFQRKGNDLHTRVTISFAQAALGERLAIPTLEGETELVIKPGTQPGTVVRLSGHGLPEMQSRRRGDLIVYVQVAVPQKLTRRQRKLLDQLAAEEQGRDC